MLIRAGADVNARNDLDVTPLWAATENGSADLVTTLLEAGADPNVPLPFGETPLMTAPRAGHADAAGDPRRQHLAVERLDNVVVGAGAEAFDDVGALALTRQQQQVHRFGGFVRAKTPADFRSLETRHHPVEYGDVGSVVGLERGQRLVTVARFDDVVTRGRQCDGEDFSADGLVFCDQDTHVGISSAAVSVSDASGSRMTNLVPLPVAVSKSMVPPCFSVMTEYAMARPCPVPLSTPLLV